MGSGELPRGCGWSTGLQVNPHGGLHDGWTSKGLRQCQGVGGMGHTVSAWSFEKTAHASAPELIFELPSPFPSAPLAVEREETTRGRQD